MLKRWLSFWTPIRCLEAFGVFTVIAVAMWEMHPNLIFSSTLLTGGDTGSHLAPAYYLRTSGSLFDPTPWYPGWFAGIPAYTYYFVLADWLAAAGSYIVGFGVSFKLATVLGSVLLPITAYTMGKLFKAPRPVPAALAMATLPFLFDASFTISGGNLFSTMAGEYGFSLSLSLALLAIGLFARGVSTGKGYWLAAIVLSLTLAAHVLPWFFAVGAVGVLVVFELLQRRGIGDPELEAVTGDYARPVRFALGAGLISLGLSAWWFFAFFTTQNLTTSMGYTNYSVSTLRLIFEQLGWFNANGGAGGDRWVITLAAVAFVIAFWSRDRLGMFLVTMASLALAAYVFDPQSVIWDERLVPFWFISVYLSAGWLFGYLAYRWVNRRRRIVLYADEVDVADDETVDALASDAADAEVASDVASWRAELVREDKTTRVRRRTLRATGAVIVLGLATTVPGLIPPVASAFGLSTAGNQVSSWAQWNYSGYQSKPAWPEYINLMDTMIRVSKRYGCGRAMWEYNTSQNRFGTPEALMLMPYWTNNCVDSMEGLFFESSPTTPYHFLDAAELEVGPSNPMVGLPYGQLNVALGVQHLQILGAKYYIAFSPATVAQANADPSLEYLTSTKHWPAPGVTWRVYLVKHSPVVEPLSTLPNVVTGVSGRVAWLNANTDWWLDPSLWSVYAAESGPSSWPRAASVQTMSTHYVTPTSVSDVTQGLQSISFHVTTLDTPVLVKMSYYPRWQVTGGLGPYRVSPNLMVVIPTSHDVSMVYGATTTDDLANTLTVVTIVAGLAVLGFVVRRRRLARR